MSGQELELKAAVEKQAQKEKLAQAYFEADQIQKQADEERKTLREEILVDFPVGPSVCGGFMVEIKEQKRTARIDWEKEILALAGPEELENIKLRHKDCAEAKPVYVVSVKKMAK